nr:leucine-rich repeat domain-containing protein [Bacteroidaceae bacterium]
MKKKFFCLFCSLICMIQAFAYNFDEGGIYYNITSSTNMTVEVTYGKNYGDYKDVSVIIPDKVTHNGKTYYVTRIGNNAFSGCTSIATVTFNDYITSVGSSAFSGCNSLNRITIPEQVTSIGNYAFSGCVLLRTVIIEDSKNTLSLGYGTMNGSKHGLFEDANLEKFYWGRPLSYSTDYGLSPLANQSTLADITIGPNVTTLSPYMFYGNAALNTFELPSTVTKLGSHAFDGFVGMTSFTIPEQITFISDYAFAGCKGLQSFTIPNQITTIGNYAFRYCTGLTTFSWGKSIESVGQGAFSGCSGLTSLTIPGYINSIGNFAFNGCSNLKTLKFEPGTEKLSLGIIGYYNDCS